MQAQVNVRDQTIINLESAKEEVTSVERRVLSLLDKLQDVTVNSDGTVTHNFAQSSGDKPRTFKDEATFKKWLNKHLKERKEDLKARLTPNQYYIT